MRRVAGFSVVELMVLVAIIGVLSAVGLPWLINLYRAQQIDGAARRVAALIQHGRQLAITQNATFRVEIDTAGNRVRFVCLSAAGCGSTPHLATNAAWTGAETDSTGYARLDGDYALDACSRTQFAFTSLGTLDTTSTPAGAVRVRNTQNTLRMDVTVYATGRVTVGAAGTCP